LVGFIAAKGRATDDLVGRGLGVIAINDSSLRISHLLHHECTGHVGRMNITSEKVVAWRSRRCESIGDSLGSADYFADEYRFRGAGVVIQREVMGEAVFIIEVHGYLCAGGNGNSLLVESHTLRHEVDGDTLTGCR
jgi:hypothetical protein